MKKTNKIAAAMAVLTMATSLSVSTASFSASAKATPAAVVMETNHMMTSDIVVKNCGNRLSRPTARVTVFRNLHTTKHVVNVTTQTTVVEEGKQEPETSWWDSVCDWFKNLF